MPLLFSHLEDLSLAHFLGRATWPCCRCTKGPAIHSWPVGRLARLTSRAANSIKALDLDYLHQMTVYFFRCRLGELVRLTRVDDRTGNRPPGQRDLRVF